MSAESFEAWAGIRDAVDEAVSGGGVFAALAELKGQIERVELAKAAVPERILVTRGVPDGSFYDAPMPGEDEPLSPSGKRQLLCSPATWDAIRGTVPGGERAQVGVLFGVPVIIEGGT